MTPHPKVQKGDLHYFLHDTPRRKPSHTKNPKNHQFPAKSKIANNETGCYKNSQNFSPFSGEERFIGITEAFSSCARVSLRFKKKRGRQQSPPVSRMEQMTTGGKSSSKKRYDVIIQQGGLCVTSQFIFVKVIKINIAQINVILHRELRKQNIGLITMLLCITTQANTCHVSG